MDVSRIFLVDSDRVGAAGASPMEQAEAATRAATSKPQAPEDGGPNGADPRDRDGDGREPLAVEHYDDLEPDEIVGLLDSLEDGDLGALRDYEQRRHARPRVMAAIEAVLARRGAGRRG